MELCVDSGAGVDVIGEGAWRDVLKTPLQETNIHLVPYGVNQALPVLGMFRATIKAREKTTETNVYVIKGQHASLLSYSTATNLGLIQLQYGVEEKSRVDPEREFPSLFTGLGKLKNFQVKLQIKTDVKPVARPHRRIPFKMRNGVEKEVRRLDEEDITEPVTGPTPWVSPIVAVPKMKDPDALRICVDMREPNVAIERQRHIMPTVEDIIGILNGAKFFSKLDLNEGYHQLELDEQSRQITTFSTHIGLRRYKRLPFGVNSAAEVFQDAIRQVLPDEDGIINISDDILVSGQNLEEHDRRLRLVLNALQTAGLTLNSKNWLW